MWHLNAVFDQYLQDRSIAGHVSYLPASRYLNHEVGIFFSENAVRVRGEILKVKRT